MINHEVVFSKFYSLPDAYVKNLVNELLITRIDLENKYEIDTRAFARTTIHDDIVELTIREAYNRLIIKLMNNDSLIKLKGYKWLPGTLNCAVLIPGRVELPLDWLKEVEQETGILFNCIYI